MITPYSHQLYTYISAWNKKTYNHLWLWNLATNRFSPKYLTQNYWKADTYFRIIITKILENTILILCSICTVEMTVTSFGWCTVKLFRKMFSKRVSVFLHRRESKAIILKLAVIVLGRFLRRKFTVCLSDFELFRNIVLFEEFMIVV